MRLIDADDFERRCMFDRDINDMQDVIYALRDFPTIDVELVKHGEWLEYGEPTYKRCSSCGKRLSPALGIFPQYCPNCGAKMGGGADND